MLFEVEQQSVLEAQRVRWLQHSSTLQLSAAADGRVTEETVRKIATLQKKLMAASDDLLASLMPWRFSPEQQQEQEKAAAAELKQRWESHFGDMADPETQKRIQATVAALQDTSNARRPTST